MGLFGKKPARLIDEREVKHKNHKLWLSIVWLIIMLISAVYCALSFVTLKNLQKIYSNNLGSLSNHNMWAPLTAAALTPALVILFFVFGTLLYLRKIMKENGATYSLGVLHASVFWLMCVMMQTAVTLHAYIDVAEDEWEGRVDKVWKSSYTTVFRVTYILAYILVGCFLLLFVLLFILKGVMKKVDLSGPVRPVATKPIAPTPHTEKAHAPPHHELATTNAHDQPILPASAADEYNSTGPLAKV